MVKKQVGDLKVKNSDIKVLQLTHLTGNLNPNKIMIILSLLQLDD